MLKNTSLRRLVSLYCRPRAEVEKVINDWSSSGPDEKREEKRRPPGKGRSSERAPERQPRPSKPAGQHADRAAIPSLAALGIEFGVADKGGDGSSKKKKGGDTMSLNKLKGSGGGNRKPSRRKHPGDSNKAALREALEKLKGKGE